MARVSGERAPAFTAQELEKLVDRVLPQYTLLYGPPDQQVSAHQKKDIWCAIAKDVRTLGVHQGRSTHCRKRWEDIRSWSKKTAEAQLGMASQCGRSARRTMTPLMSRILAVAYPELDGRMRASQQIQGAVTPAKVGKGQKKAPKSGKSSTAEKAAIISAAQDATASPIVTGQETTARVSAQEGSPIVTGQETTASQCPGGQPNRHRSGDHRQSQCTGGQPNRHRSGDYRQSQCPGGQPNRHWSGDHRQSQCPGGPRQPQPRWAMRDRHGTHRCTGQRQQSQETLNRAKTAMASTAEQGKHC
ncbi:hypothetical protein NDU88_009502 [Pleurodeles waltl]|uniref:Myb/SANT-like DNA-binding domain-containing protein n=1 Tax=Pleurodeles waltl TaxID=8319 RepID=A0AAV7PSY2_PLEWA|nr:hypothetical protein NDU88_009502 [Pleurodeles waltl]